tara:strand:+ start:211 stop:882 length:672 start_codon:yes stop_codon:yes gene_type:complete
MFFAKKVLDSEKVPAVYMWNMKPGETAPIPLKNIYKNERFFNTSIVGPKEIDQLVIKIKNPLLKDLWKKIPWWIVKADLGRLLYVYLNGGFYFDADCLVKKNFLSCIEKNTVLFVEKRLRSTNKLGPREKKTSDRLLRIANYAFGSGVKKSPFLKKVIDECLLRVSLFLKDSPKNISEKDVVWLCGPDVITSVYHDFKHLFPDLILLEKNNLNHQSFGGWREK